MKKKKIVIALGHDALGTTLPEQHEATKHTAKAVADFIRDDYEVVITHSNGPQRNTSLPVSFIRYQPSRLNKPS